MDSRPQADPLRILVLHRFDGSEIERFVSRLLVPQLCKHAICFRIRQAGNIPGEPGYWLHLFQLLSGIADAVVTVEFASESYSENIFFEQVLVPQLATGKTLRAKLFEAGLLTGAATAQFATVPLLTLSVLDCPDGEYFIWPDPDRSNLIVDVRTATPTELVSNLAAGTSDFLKTVADRATSYQRAVPHVMLYERSIFWGLVRHPLIAAAVSVDVAEEGIAGLYNRANSDDPDQLAGDRAANELLHDPAALEWWRGTSQIMSDRNVPRSAADKIRAVQAKKWQWIVRPNNRSRIRTAAYDLIWRAASRIQIARYRRLR